MDKSKFKIRVIISFFLGLVIGGIGIYYIYDTSYSEYDLSMLNDIERMSYNFHRAYDPSSSGEAQASYILYTYRAWKAGVISDEDRYLHQSIGLLRSCISYEKQDMDDTAKKACILSKKDLELWNPKLNFDEFRKIVDSEYFTIDMLDN